MDQSIERVVQEHPQLFVQQRKELIEIMVDWETANRYAILSPQKTDVGFVAERKGGFASMLTRGFLRSHRPLKVDIFDTLRQCVLQISRPFHFFFSDMEVTTPAGQLVGSIHRRFGLIFKKYDLKDERGHIFARVKSPIWRLWRFPLMNQNDDEVAQISKRWGGALREIFTDADTYQIDFGRGGWTLSQKAVILATAISIDLDFFENNQGSRGVLGALGD